MPPELHFQYVMVLYSRTVVGTGSGDEEEVFAGHMSHSNCQNALGRDLIRGRLAMIDHLGASVERIETPVATDPAVVSG